MLGQRFEAGLMGMSIEASPVVVEVLMFEDLPLGSLVSRRAVVRWSDGSEGGFVTAEPSTRKFSRRQ